MFLFMLSFLGLVPTFQKSKCKKLLNITMERIKLLKSRREAQLRQLHIDVAQLFKLHKEQKAQVWLRRIRKEACLLSVYVKVAEYCQSVQTNLKKIAEQRECPGNLEEPLAGLCFAASRCADLPELQELREIFAMKYGKDFVTSAQELHEDCHVNQEFLDDLCATNPSDVQKMALLEEITTQANEQDNKQHGSSSTEVSMDANESNYSQDPQEEIDRTMMDSEVEDGKDELGTEKLQETYVVLESDNHAATVCEEDLGSTELANRKRTLEGRQSCRSKSKRAFRPRKLAWQNKDNDKEGNPGEEHEKTVNKVHAYVGEKAKGEENGNDTGARLANIVHDDAYKDCGSLQGEGTAAHMPEAPNEDQHIILYVEEPSFSMPPQRPPPPPPPPKRAPPLPPSFRVVSMPTSQSKQTNANIPLPLRCSTMANNHFIESHVHPKLPKYEDFVANFTARKREAF